MQLSDLTDRYQRDGFLSPVDIISSTEADRHRQALEDGEASIGALHYQTKVHTLLRSPFELATNQKVLDVVEALIGPNILLYNVTYIVKEPHSPSHVSWHQDLTYWGFDSDDQVSMWLALSPASRDNGCMRMLPGSHLHGRMHHELTDDKTNVLFSGQSVFGVDESAAIACPLHPGQASFHHGWTLHASMPNNSNDRRIGVNVQYLATHVRQTKNQSDTALLVRGVDNYRHFAMDRPAVTDLEPDAVGRRAELQQRYYDIAAARK